jgi:hypothetical protein
MEQFFISNETAGDLPCRANDGEVFPFYWHATIPFAPGVKFSWLSDATGWHSVFLEQMNYTMKVDPPPPGGLWDPYLVPPAQPAP